MSGEALVLTKDAPNSVQTTSICTALGVADCGTTDMVQHDSV